MAHEADVAVPATLCRRAGKDAAPACNLDMQKVTIFSHMNMQQV
jgi:hypothetical protein